jgi:hypothetical protein
VKQIQRLRIAVTGLLVAVAILSVVHAWDRWRSAALLEQVNSLRAERAARQEDQAYVRWLEKQVSRFEEGEPGRWRERAHFERAYAARVAARAEPIWEGMFPPSPGLLPGARTSSGRAVWAFEASPPPDQNFVAYAVWGSGPEGQRPREVARLWIAAAGIDIGLSDRGVRWPQRCRRR